MAPNEHQQRQQYTTFFWIQGTIHCKTHLNLIGKQMCFLESVEYGKWLTAYLMEKQGERQGRMENFKYLQVWKGYGVLTMSPSLPLEFQIFLKH